MKEISLFLPYATDILFCFVFVTVSTETIYRKDKLVLYGSIWTVVFASAAFILYYFIPMKLFLFYFPITGVLLGCFYAVYYSALDGAKAMLPFLISVYCVTVTETIIRVIRINSFANFGVLLSLRAVIFIIIVVAYVIFIKPFLQMVFRYTSEGWFYIDISFLIYALMIYMLDIVLSHFNVLPVKIGLEILMFVIFLSLIFIINQTLGDSEEDFKRRMIAEQRKAISEQAANFRENEKKISILRHDMRHNIAIVTQLLENGQIADALETLKKTDGDLEKSRSIKHCENVYINATLALLERKANKQHIGIEYRTDIRENDKLDVYRLAIVISNLIENAINACTLLEDENARFIEVEARDSGSSLIVSIRNSFDGDVIFDNDGYPTTGKEGHGIGTKSVLTFIEEHDGMIDYSVKEDVFAVKFLINYDG